MPVNILKVGPIDGVRLLLKRAHEDISNEVKALMIQQEADLKASIEVILKQCERTSPLYVYPGDSVSKMSQVTMLMCSCIPEKLVDPVLCTIEIVSHLAAIVNGMDACCLVHSILKRHSASSRSD